MKSFLLGLILGLIALPLAAYVYFQTGHPPVAVADKPFPMEQQIVSVPLQARIESEMTGTAPIHVTAANLQAGARIYGQQCAACHGSYDRPSSFAKHMYPQAPQLWERHGRKNAVGVSDDPPGETYWKIANGIRLTGMPSFDKILDPTQMWQVTLLLSRANQPLPADVQSLIKRPAAVNDAALTHPHPAASAPKLAAAANGK
ncbi:MAG: cytochrome c [Acidobacteriaceae bacterium]